MTIACGAIVVGASLAGLSVVRELRAAGFAEAITVVGDEVHLPYDRPPLSKAFLAEDCDLGLVPQDDLDALTVNWLLGKPASNVTTGPDGRHTVEIAGVPAATAEVVVLATGARARRLPGAQVAGVHTLRTLDDALALRRSLQQCARLVVIGAGFIGAEVASTAAEQGIDVTIVEACEKPLERPLGDVIAASCTALHDANGVRLLTGAGVDRLRCDGNRVHGVFLTDGTELSADVVVVGIGAQPNTEWLSHPAIVTGNGFRADACGRTAVAGIYALGDCAATFDPQLDTHHRSEHWTNATAQAKTVAAAITGRDRPAPAAPYFWSKQYGHQLQFAGYRTDDDTVQIVDGDPAAGPFVATYERGGRVVAVFARDNARLFTRYRKQIERDLR